MIAVAGDLADRHGAVGARRKGARAPSQRIQAGRAK